MERQSGSINLYERQKLTCPDAWPDLQFIFGLAGQVRINCRAGQDLITFYFNPDCFSELFYPKKFFFRDLNS